MEFRGILGGLYRLSEWIMRLAVTNLLWVLCSSPFFFLLATAVYSSLYYGTLDYLWQMTPFLALLAPVTVFPATAGMFTLARKWVMGDADVPLIRGFFRGYKENFLHSLFGGIVFVLIFATLYINFTFYNQQPGTLNVLAVVFIVLAVYVLCAMIHFFSVMVHFHMKFWQVIKNSFIVAISNPIMAFVLISSNALVLYISFSLFRYLVPLFFMGSMMAIVSFWNFYRIYMRMKTLNEKRKKEQAEASAETEGEAPAKSAGMATESERDNDRGSERETEADSAQDNPKTEKDEK